jgi:6-phosphogluconolactonase (cycloisomerase 2 family)
MKLKNFGRAALALAASAVMVLGMTSCTLSFTVGYLFVTGSQYNQIASYRIQNDNGALHATSTVGSGGTDPIQAVVTSTGTFVYVLNYGTGTDAKPAISSIALFSIGGYGGLTYQASFSPKGFNTRSIQISGNYLYALDEFAPGGAGPGGTQSYGDISAFSIDGATGRLTAVPNTQQTDQNNLPLFFFPVGTNPTWLSLSGAFAYVAEQGPVGSTNPNDPPQAIFTYNQNATNGQLTLTQSTPLPTGATQLTYIYATAQYIYALDAGPVGSTGFILPFTNSGGTLAAVSGGARANNGQGSNPVFPSRMIKESTQNFLYVSSQGINTTVGGTSSLLTAYVVNSLGQLVDAQNGGNPIPVGTGPLCIVEDPSNLYVYTANFNDSTLTGKKIDQKAGGLDALPKGLPTPPGSPTWCAVTGATF